MSDSAEGFVDVQPTPTGFSLPRLKWRELLFIGALRSEGEGYVRDPGRPMPPFAAGEIFPVGVTFRVDVRGQRVEISAVAPSSGRSGE